MKSTVYIYKNINANDAIKLLYISPDSMIQHSPLQSGSNTTLMNRAPGPSRVQELSPRAWLASRALPNFTTLGKKKRHQHRHTKPQMIPEPFGFCKYLNREAQKYYNDWDRDLSINML